MFKLSGWISTGARLVLLAAGLGVCASAQLQFRTVDRALIESRLKAYSRKNEEREAILKNYFAQSGCQAGEMSEEVVKKKLPPNLICILPGITDKIILVGAHSDHVEVGDGVVDNWSGAVLLPSLLSSMNGQPRQHTFVFVAFTGEEKGLLGSAFYVRQLAPEQRSKIAAMIDIDTLGLGPTKVWLSHSDPVLASDLAAVANAMNLPVAGVNVENVGSSDAESFATYKVPRITVHSVTQDTWPVLHSKRDQLTAIKMDDYYASYHLLAGYLAFLDTDLNQEKPAASKATR